MSDIRDLFSRWIEIDLEVLKHNLEQVKSSLSPNAKVMAVVKADAYGCGSVECAKAFIAAGCDMLGVTTLEEAVELREHGIKTAILAFEPLISVQAATYIKYKITPTIIDKEGIEALSAFTDDLFPIHLKIESGMGRLGVRPNQVEDLLQTINTVKNIRLEGIYTHFAKASVSNFVKKQVENLTSAADKCRLAGLENFTIHACASAAYLKYPEYHFDMVRIGTLLYGQLPAGITTSLKLEDPWQCKGRVLQVKDIAVGESVGYGRDFIADKALKIAIIPIGLADGFNLDPPLKPKNIVDLIKVIIKAIISFWGRPLRATGAISFQGKNLPIIGRIGMQLMAVDVTSQEHLGAGQVVEITIRRTSASSRLTRLYIEEGKIKEFRSIAGKHLLETAYLEGMA